MVAGYGSKASVPKLAPGHVYIAILESSYGKSAGLFNNPFSSFLCREITKGSRVIVDVAENTLSIYNIKVRARVLVAQ